jgi:antitoxin CcdA
MTATSKRETLQDQILRDANLAPNTPEAQAYLEKLRQTWLSANAGAIASSNGWIERNGLPLARYRQF